PSSGCRPWGTGAPPDPGRPPEAHDGRRCTPCPRVPPPGGRPRPPRRTRPAPVRTGPASARTAPVRPPGPYRAPARGPDVTGTRPGRHRRASRAGTRDHRGMDVTLHLAQDPEADALLGRSPLAALTGMLLDQQVPMEWAF